jgi:hypothetical protein
MNELQEALNLVDAIAAGRSGADALRRVRRLLETVRERYFFAESDTAILPADDPVADEVIVLTETPPQPAA